MQKLAALPAAVLAAFQLLLCPSALLAQERAEDRYPPFASAANAPSGQVREQVPGRGSRQGSNRTLLRQTWVEEWDPAARQWVRVSEVRSIAVEERIAARFEPAAAAASPGGRAQSGPVFGRETANRQSSAATTFVRNAAPRPALWSAPRRAAPFDRAMTATYGPFRVADARRALLVGSTDANTPRLFDAMLRDFPGIEVIEMVDAPGTDHDIANLALGRRIREAGIATYVPAGGSVRSGAVELFLAGSERTIEPGARFAVHSWLDGEGREADDFAPDAPAHRMYIGYYVEMGLSEQRARDFYAMTNSVPHSSALWLRADEMRSWITPARPPLVPRSAAGALRATVFSEPPASLPEMALDLPVPQVAKPAAARQRDALPSIDYADLTRATFAWGGMHHHHT